MAALRVLSALLFCAGIVLAGGGVGFLRRPLGAAYTALWAVWMVATAVWRKPGVRSKYDRGQPWLLAALSLVMPVIMFVPPWEHVRFSGPLPRAGAAPWLGIAILAVSVAMTAEAMRRMRGQYTVRLGIQPGHRLITTGPYRIVRHPGYAGFFLGMIGIGLGMGSLAAFLALPPVVWVVRRRVRREEEMLLEAFGDDYRAYMRRTGRLLPFLVLIAAPLAAADLRAGAGSVKITPPPGTAMAGYYYNRAAEGVHDDLWAKALVFEKDGSRAALVACDLAMLSRPVVERARRLIESATGIPGASVMISATHTHTGPALTAGKYVDELPGRIAESVKLANAALRPARVSAAIGREDSLAFNRRYFMKDGTVGWNPGKLNPNIVRPAGPIDPAAPVIYVEGADGAPVALYVNYAMHLDTVGGREFSADYPYTLAGLMAKLHGAGMLTMFTIGAAGNVNHINVSTRARQQGHAEAARIGTVLAGEVLRTWPRLAPIEAGVPRVRSETVKLPPAPIGPGDLEKARTIAATYGTPDAAPFLDLVWAFKAIAVAERTPIAAEVQVLSLGPQLAMVGLPGEIFVELGLAIKFASPYRYTVIVELANDSIGYVPNRKAYSEGAYEVVSARCAEGSGEMLVEAALRLLGR